jgi:TP901 family phage tail tape measure protein
VTNGMADNTNTASSADTSSVTAIKVKVVLDTTTEELKNQFKGVQNSFKKAPVEIAFGVNEGATIGNVNAALKRIIKKVESPKLTLKIDESNVDAAVQKAAKKVQGSTSKSNGAIKVNVDVDESEKKLKEFYSLVEKVNTLNNKALSLPDGNVNELKEYNKLIDEAGARMKILMNELSDKIEIGSMSQLESEMKVLEQRTAMVVARLKDAEVAAGKTEFGNLVKEIGELNTKIETADYSKQTNQIQEWTRQLQIAEGRLTELMNTYGEYINIEEGSDLDKLTRKVTGKENLAVAKKADTEQVAELNARMQEFYDLVKKVNDLNNKAMMLPEGSVRELEECNRQLDEMGTRMTELMNELSGNIEIGEFSKLDTIMNELNNRSALFAARLADIQAKSGQKEFYSLVKEIGELNNKLSTADPSKQGSQIEVWQRRLAEAETELTNLMNTLREYISIGEGSELDKLQQKLQFQSDNSFAKQLDNSRIAIQNFIKEYATLSIKLHSVDSINPDNQELVNLRNSLPEIERRVQSLSLGLRQAIETGDLSGLYLQFNTLRTAIDATNISFANLSSESKLTGKELDNRLHLDNLIRELQKYKDSLTSAFNGSEYEQEYERILAMLKDSSTYFKAGEQAVENFKNACYKAGLETETLGQKLSRLFKEHFQTAIAMAGVAMVKQGLREVYDNVLELDTAVTELKKVSKMTGDEMNEYLDRTATNARELGANISDLVSSTADWKRLGYTDKDSEELARVSALMANVGDQIDNATTASSYLISTMQGFGLVADDAEHLLDCMNQIANTEPVSMNDLGIIMQKSSAAMSAAGNTYQETLSLAAAVNGVLQDSEASGTYLKTLSMYLRASKTDAENAGIATDGMASSVSELRSELKQLAGVDIMKDDNTFKSTYQIMKELSEVWKDLSDTTQANITELIAGKRGGQSTSALLNNFSVAEDAMKQALNSSGSAMRENQTYMDSLQAKLNQLDSAFQKFSTDLMKSDIPKFFVDLATVFVDGADSAVKFAGALPTLTAAISGVLSVMQMSGKLKNGAGKVNMPSYICCV